MVTHEPLTQQLRCTHFDQYLGFEIDARIRRQVFVRWPSVAIAAAVRTASIRIHTEVEEDVRAIDCSRRSFASDPEYTPWRYAPERFLTFFIVVEVGPIVVEVNRFETIAGRDLRAAAASDRSIDFPKSNLSN